MLLKEIEQHNGCVVVWDTGEANLYGGTEMLQGHIRPVQLDELVPVQEFLKHYEPKETYCKCIDRTIVQVFWKKGFTNRELLGNSFVPEDCQ